MSVTSGDGGSTLSLSFDGDSNGPLCTCCYIGVYSSFASPITWSFPDTENLGKLKMKADTDVSRILHVNFKTNLTY